MSYTISEIDGATAKASQPASNAKGVPVRPVNGSCLYDANGNPIVVSSGDALGSTKGVPVLGSDGTNFRLLKTNASGELSISASTNNGSDSNKYYITPFGEQKVAAPYALLDEINTYYLDPTIWGTSLAGTASVIFNATKGMTEVRVGANNNDRARLRTHTYYKYQTGKAHQIRISVVHPDTGKSNQTRRWGYLEDNDGLFFELVGVYSAGSTQLRIVRRTSTSGSPVVGESVNQADWNVDKMNGTGPSGVTLDITKGNLYEVIFQYLGVGYAWFFINGNLVHIMHNPNTIAGMYMRTAQLPVQVEVVNTGSSVASGIDFCCASVSSFGGTKPPMTAYGVKRSSFKNVNTTSQPILAIRPRATFQGRTNRMQIIPTMLEAQADNRDAIFSLLLNPTLTGASFSAVATDSGVEYDTSATGVSGGTLLYNVRIAYPEVASNVFDLERVFSYLCRTLKLNAFATVQDTLVVAANTDAATVDVNASLFWDETK